MSASRWFARSGALMTAPRGVKALPRTRTWCRRGLPRTGHGEAANSQLQTLPEPVSLPWWRPQCGRPQSRRSSIRIASALSVLARFLRSRQTHRLPRSTLLDDFVGRLGIDLGMGEPMQRAACCCLAEHCRDRPSRPMASLLEFESYHGNLFLPVTRTSSTHTPRHRRRSGLDGDQLIARERVLPARAADKQFGMGVADDSASVTTRSRIRGHHKGRTRYFVREASTAERSNGHGESSRCPL